MAPNPRISQNLSAKGDNNAIIRQKNQEERLTPYIFIEAPSSKAKI